MSLTRSLRAALAAAVISAATYGVPALAATEDEPVDIPAQAEQLAPQWQLREGQAPSSHSSRIGSLADRCRPANEYAQLGEFDDESLNFLRRGCR